MTLLEMMRVWWRLRSLKPVGLSVDITDRCTLSCAGCYMKWYGRNDDLPRGRWEEIILSFPASERVLCAWTGGEPLLRADDVRALSRHFRWTWVATNGTVPIPDLPRTTVFVSVDGPREIHDSLRGRFDEIVKHVRPEHYVACTVRRRNSSPDALRELVEFWHEKARGIVFGFLTPRRQRPATEDTEERENGMTARPSVAHEMGGARFPAGRPGPEDGNGVSLALPRPAFLPFSVYSVTSVAKEGERGVLGREERKRVVKTLRELRREFGGFILGVPGQVDDCARTAWGGKCPAAAALVTFDAAGRRKYPCTLGSEVDCSRCGCAVPGFLRRVRRLDVRTLAGVAGLFRAG